MQTTSTAGGNPIAHPLLFGVDPGPIQGIAPGAYLMSYKALGPQGGFDSDLVAAIEQAVYDSAPPRATPDRAPRRTSAHGR